jgi:hypothetical protein
MRQIQKVYFVGLIASIGTLSNCAPKAASVWVERHATADSLVFGIGLQQGGAALPRVDVVTVCCTLPSGYGDRQWMWQLVASDSITNTPTRIRYGRRPNGYLVGAGPRPLMPARYRVRVKGAGYRAYDDFLVNTDGTITDLGRVP